MKSFLLASVAAATLIVASAAFAGEAINPCAQRTEQNSNTAALRTEQNSNTAALRTEQNSTVAQQEQKDLSKGWQEAKPEQATTVTPCPK
jgi:Flp pilus assembly protein TadB